MTYQGYENPEAVERRKALADALMARTLTQQPKNVGEGLAAIGKALMYRQMMGGIEGAEAAGKASAAESFAGMFFPPAPSMDSAPSMSDAMPSPGSVGSVPFSGGMEDYASAISNIESGGNYQALGPYTGKGRAYGKYQVMDFNIGPWTKEVLGQEFTPQQFLASPEAQDAVFNAKFGGYIDQYGSPQEAASMWFTGRPIAQGGNLTDVNNTSGNKYVSMFNSHLGGGQPETIAAMQAQASGINPADPSTIPVMAGGTMGARPPGGPTMPELANVLSNPWLSKGQQRIAEALMERKIAPQSLVNAGGGNLYDPNSGNWIQAPNSGADAPTVKQFYDESGNPYMAEWNSQTRAWDRVGGSKAPSGMSVRTNPDGSVEIVQGPGAGKLSETQSKSATYATRAEGSLSVLDEFGSALTSPYQRAVEGDPTGILRGTQSPEFQKARQAGNEFLQAILRKDTGAAITSQEMDSYGRTYLPTPGDGPEVLAQKQAARKRALEALKAGMEPQAILAQERALKNSEAAPGTVPARERKNRTKSGVSWEIE